MEPRRKRQRKSLNCTMCKKRKIKCDKKRPCSSCVRYKKPCIYESAPEKESSSPEPEPEYTPANHHSNGSNSTHGSVATDTKESNSVKFLPQDSENVYEALNKLKRKLALLESNVSSANGDSAHDPRQWKPSSKFRTFKENQFWGYNPVAAMDDNISFHGSVCSMAYNEHRIRNHGPMSWFGLMRMDAAVSPLVTYLFAQRENIKAIYEAEKAGVKQKTELRFRKKDDELLQSDAEPLLPLSLSLREKLPNATSALDRALSMGNSFYQGGIDRELALIDRIKLVLPKTRVIWMLVRRFFTHVYPFLPFLDETEFLDIITELIGPEEMGDEKLAEIKMTKKLDFVHLGILLLVLRFAYLTLFTNSEKVNEAMLTTRDQSPEAQEKKYLLQNPVSIDSVGVAESCLYQFNILKTLKLTLLQLMLYLKVYKAFSPEEGDCRDSCDINVTSSLVVHTAIALGLNRDADQFPEHRMRDKRTNNLCRKIWYFILILDANNTLANGLVGLIDPNSFDTKVPVFDTEAANSSDLEREHFVVRTFDRMDRVYFFICSIFRYITNVRAPCNLQEFCSKLELLEVNYIATYGSLEEHVHDVKSSNSNESHFKVVRVKIYLTTCGFIISVYFHIFNYYESRGNQELAFFYLKKSLVLIVQDLLPHYALLLDKGHELFAYVSDLIIVPVLENLIHKSLIILLGIYMRTKYSKYAYETSSDHARNMRNPEYSERYYALLKLGDYCYKSQRYLAKVLERISNRYFYAWRLVKANTVSLATAQNDDFYKNNKGQPLLFSTEFVEKINDIFADVPLTFDEARPTETADTRTDPELLVNPQNIFDTQGFWDTTPPQNVDDIWAEVHRTKFNEPQEFVFPTDFLFEEQGWAFGSNDMGFSMIT